ncbi:MAG TPA: FAD:protein FMN transferase [Pseudomonadales bacterium]
MKLFTHTFHAMGTRCETQLYAAGPDDAARAAAAVQADVDRLEAKYSRYRATSFLSDINYVAASSGSIDVDAETAHLLDYAATCYAESRGLFDITSGVLRRAWDFKGGVVPEPERVATLLQHVGWHRLRWQSPALAFPEPGLELDFGGIVKEYAADRAATSCREHGIDHALVNLGGDIRVVGPHPDGSPWRIAIRDPGKTDGVLQQVELDSGALASSGDYERCIDIGGVRYGHILNPHTGWPVRHLAAVSVAAEYCVIAGSAATIAMLLEHDGPEWLRELGLPHVWVDVEGNSGGSL